MAIYKTIHTKYGLQRIAQAEATGRPINLVAMAVGDGKGNPVTPDEEQTNLVREIAATRNVPNRVYQDPADPGIFIAELVIPESIAGFTIREWGIYDDDGGLFAVGNLPETYKPMRSEGAYGDTIVRVKFAVTNADVVTILVDPNIAVASQTWVVTNITAAKLLPGGLTGQIPMKASNADGDIVWHDPTNVNVVVNTIEEQQTLAENQTTVNLVLTNTTGLAVYVAGQRLPPIAGADGWQPHPTIPTRITLGKAYAAGTRLTAVQNEPASHLPDALDRDKNLADLEDKALARYNLGVYSATQVDTLISSGAVMHWARNTAPPGWLKANGAAISRTAYAGLFAVIGTTYGEGDGFNTFNIPDLRGEFIRGLDDGRGVDPSRLLGSAQGGQNLAHTHTGTTGTSGSHSHSYVDGRPIVPPGGPQIQAGSNFTGIWENQDSRTTGSAGSHSHSLTTDSSGGTEARPRNIALLACIKY